MVAFDVKMLAPFIVRMTGMAVATSFMATLLVFQFLMRCFSGLASTGSRCDRSLAESGVLFQCNRKDCLI
jgi:hypothetical protein